MALHFMIVYQESSLSVCGFLNVRTKSIKSSSFQYNAVVEQSSLWRVPVPFTWQL